MMMSSHHQEQPHTHSLDLDYPSNWSIDDVIVWLHDISLEAYSENFRSRIFQKYFIKKMKFIL
jgi:hypothetical protein